MKRILVAASILSLFAAPAWSRTILFVGNSFTYGQNSAARFYQSDTVIDLNGPIGGRTVGGVPALFKASTIRSAWKPIPARGWIFTTPKGCPCWTRLGTTSSCRVSRRLTPTILATRPC